MTNRFPDQDLFEDEQEISTYFMFPELITGLHNRNSTNVFTTKLNKVGNICKHTQTFDQQEQNRKTEAPPYTMKEMENKLD